MAFMMTPKLASGALVASALLLVLVVSDARSSGQAGALVRLQATSPGVSQSGNANLSGIVRAGQFIGGGTGLTALNASNISGGTLATSLFPVPLWLNGSVAAPVLAGINSSSTLGATGVGGTATANSGVTFGVYGESQSTNGRGVYGQALASTGAAYGLYGLSSSNGGYGLFAEANSATGNTYGVYGQSLSANGTAVFGNAPSANGANFGGRFFSASMGGTGVLGSVTAATGNTLGGRFESASSSGTGVLGLATSVTGSTYGGRFESNSSTGIGLYGRANSTSGIVTGVFGQTGSPDGYGVYGYASGSADGDGAAVFGESFGEDRPGLLGISNLSSGTWAYAARVESKNSTNSRNVGIEAEADNATYNYGVKATARAFGGTYAFGVDAFSDKVGIISLAPQAIVASSLSTLPSTKVVDASNSAGTAVFGQIWTSNVLDYGVYGEVQTGYGVFSDGDMGATGVKSFVIDHPFDPENRYLKHFCTEGPTPTNAYSGNVVTDKEGKAWVLLPNYFGEINANFRYQLTCIGTFASAIVSQEIKDNRFEVRTDKPNVKVSWRVEADRNDRYVQEHPVQAEVDKPSFQRGTYLRPELYGLPRQRKTTYDREREKLREFQKASHKAGK